MPDGSAPRVAVTVADPSRAGDRAAADVRNRLYADAIARHGGQPVLVSTADSPMARRDALAGMAGLLLSGGTDIDPDRYGGRPGDGTEVDVRRDALEAEAWAEAERRQLPVLGVCRGMQAINVFAGGRLLGDVRAHRDPGWAAGRPLMHPLRVAPGTRLARVLFPTNPRGGVLDVNSFHHQAVRPSDLAPGLVASATASSPAGEIVEALETRSGRFVIGVQCHPERRDSMPREFERLFRVFVDACRGAATER